MSLVPEWQTRTELLVGPDTISRLAGKHVLLVGLGGVGSFAAEFIARAGIGRMTIADGDRVVPSNRNRQLPALVSTTGRLKADIMRDRLLDINPDLNLEINTDYLKDEKMIHLVQKSPYDLVVDCIDTLAPKVFFIYHTVNARLPLVSSMGAGGKVDPAKIRISDLAHSYNCTLAQMVRKRLHRLGVRSGFPVVFSPEPIDKTKLLPNLTDQNKKSTIGTISYMPAAFGMYVASVAIRQLAGLPIDELRELHVRGKRTGK